MEIEIVKTPGANFSQYYAILPGNAKIPLNCTPEVFEKSGVPLNKKFKSEIKVRKVTVSFSRVIKEVKAQKKALKDEFGKDLEVSVPPWIPENGDEKCEFLIISEIVVDGRKSEFKGALEKIGDIISGGSP